MDDLTVENMFSERYYTSQELVPGMALGALDRKKILEHVIAKVTSDILSAPGSNPVGLTITVQLADMQFLREPHLLVRATAPQYQLDEAFFSA